MWVTFIKYIFHFFNVFIHCLKVFISITYSFYFKGNLSFKKLVLSVSKFSCFNKVRWPCTSIVFVSVILSLNCGQVTAAEYIFSSLKGLFPFQFTYVQLGSSNKDQNFQNGKIKTKKSTGFSFWASASPIFSLENVLRIRKLVPSTTD